MSSARCGYLQDAGLRADGVDVHERDRPRIPDDLLDLTVLHAGQIKADRERRRSSGLGCHACARRTSKTQVLWCGPAIPHPTYQRRGGLADVAGHRGLGGVDGLVGVRQHLQVVEGQLIALVRVDLRPRGDPR
eukprot:scaffold602_cov342-Prasinococcus_capsulatus_cf.AAC.9